MADISCLAVSQPSTQTDGISNTPQVTALPPRPAPPTSRYTADAERVASWWDHAEQFVGADPYDRPAAWDAFGADLPAGAA